MWGVMMCTASYEVKGNEVGTECGTMCRVEVHTVFGGEMYRGENILKTYV